jgi:hypothetical protein
MYVLKGFANHALLANNTPGSNNAIGEISNQSLTYSREIGQYVNAVAPNITLISFLSAANGVAQPIESGFETRTMTIIEWIYNLALTESGQMYADVFLNQILAAFQGQASNFQCGNIVSDAAGHYIPEWVSWSDSVDTIDPSNFVRIWFADASFSAQYDEFAIVVVPPITPLDDFFKTGTEVEAEVNAVTISQLFTNAQNAKGGFPETIFRSDMYNWNDPLQPTHLVPTQWTTLIYGIAGNNIDSIKDALIAYILANSSHSQADWTQIFPDIFKRTEFTLVPNWGNYAIPNRVVEAGIYSPIANLSAENAQLTSYASSYPTAHINAHATVFGHPYKSLAIGAIGSDQNRDNLYELTQVFPDFISVSSQSTDFARMSQDTQGWAELLEQMLIVAEAMGPFTSIPTTMTRLTRNNQLFIVASYDNIHYLVAAKYNFPASS